MLLTSSLLYIKYSDTWKLTERWLYEVKNIRPNKSYISKAN